MAEALTVPFVMHCVCGAGDPPTSGRIPTGTPTECRYSVAILCGSPESRQKFRPSAGTGAARRGRKRNSFLHYVFARMETTEEQGLGLERSLKCQRQNNTEPESRHLSRHDGVILGPVPVSKVTDGQRVGQFRRMTDDSKRPGRSVQGESSERINVRGSG
mgnify:CR=1 FL=1